MSKVIKTTTAACYLSEELLMEILKRLPVKYILQCRCVRQSWYSFLHSPYFIALHSSHQNSSKKYLLLSNRIGKSFSLRFDDEQCNEYCELRFPQDVEQDFRNRGTVVYETCKGVICLSAIRMHQVYLWNPTVRAFNVLPDSPKSFDDSLTNFTTLGLAFGYLAKTNDYKVIKFEKYRKGPEYYVYVYSVSTDSWKTIKKAKVGEVACNKITNSVVVNGAAYWIGSIKICVAPEKVVVCFDMESDTIREIVFPPPYSKDNANSVVLVENFIFGELLSLFYYDKLTSILHIWVLENAGKPNEIWKKKTNLNLEPNWRPLGFRNNRQMVLKDGKKFVSYDLEKKEGKYIVNDDSLRTVCVYRETYPFPHQCLNRFQESLLLLDVNRQKSANKIAKPDPWNWRSLLELL